MRIALRAGGNTRECRGRATQLSVWGECEGESVECHVPIQLSHSIGRMPIVTLLLLLFCIFDTKEILVGLVLTGSGLVCTGVMDVGGFDLVLR